MRQSHKKKSSYNKGRWGEWLVLLYLMGKGYWPLAWRYKTPVGEIDLLMRRGQTLVAVEVKTYHQVTDYIVLPSQQARIQKALGWFLTKHPKWSMRPQRCDVVLITNHRIMHMENAF